MDEDPAGELLHRYREFLTTERGLATVTAGRYIDRPRPFLDCWMSAGQLELGGLTLTDVTAFVVAWCPCRSSDVAKLTVTALRSFLGFPHLGVITERSLVHAVQTIALDRDDFDAGTGMVTIRHGKFDGARALPLHPSTVAALADHLHRDDRPRPAGIPPLPITSTGKRLRHGTVQPIFQKLLHHCGMALRSATCRHRIHGLRHGFAVGTISDDHRSGDSGSRLALLFTHLGLSDPGDTCRYLSATPELLALAGERLERHRYCSLKSGNSLVAGAFLDHLEHERQNGVRTRNARLAAIRSLFRHAARRDPEHAATIERVLAIPPKCFERRLVTSLTEAEFDALLAAPDRATWAEQRRLAGFVERATAQCPSPAHKRVTMLVLRRSAALRLPRAGIDTSVIALWLGHEQIETTRIHLRADLRIKERALERTAPIATKPGRFRPADIFLAFLEALRSCRPVRSGPTRKQWLAVPYRHDTRIGSVARPTKPRQSAGADDRLSISEGTGEIGRRARRAETGFGRRDPSAKTPRAAGAIVRAGRGNALPVQLGRAVDCRSSTCRRDCRAMFREHVPVHGVATLL